MFISITLGLIQYLWKYENKSIIQQIVSNLSPEKPEPIYLYFLWTTNDV